MLTPAGLFQTSLTSCSLPNNGLSEQLFLSPPDSAGPYTWWHWMNGNVTKSGITRDLEAMKEAGIAGFQLFEAGTGIPQGHVEYLSEEWHELIGHTINEAERLELEFGMHNSPGWSSSGGPWVTPEMAMQHLSWTETFITGGNRVNIKLQKPYSNLDYYRDIMVLAFPSLPGEGALENKIYRLSSDKGEESVNKLIGMDPAGVNLIPETSGAQAYLLLEFDDFYEFRNIVIESSGLITNRQSGEMTRIPGNSSIVGDFFIEASVNGSKFTRITGIGPGSWGAGGSEALAARMEFPLTRAKYIRIVTTGARNITNVRFSCNEIIPDISVKTNFTHSWSHLPEILDSSSGLKVEASQVIKPEEVRDITNYMDQDGLLTWDAPVGDWTIIRMGYTPAGTVNRSAPTTGSGLEVDKYRSEALDFHFEHMFKRLLPMLKPLTSRGKVGLLIDSYEVGMQTWTRDMPGEFLQRCGYSLKNYIPAITGRYVGNNDITHRFLHDLRRTHADLIGNLYYGRFSELCEKNGIISYIEPICRGPMEEFQVASRAEVPMGEFWAGLHLLYPHNIEHRRSLKLAASATHVRGSKIVGAEAFTAEPHSGKWQQYPFSLKAMGDYYFTEGVNRFIFHRFAHQPQHPDVLPGMTMGHWGTHFDRTNTWWKQSNGWIKYLSRCQYILQQGLFVADILYHTGDLVPKYTDIAREDLSLIPPEGFDYDIINTESFLKQVSFRNNLIALPDGMSYRVFVLSKNNTITLEMAQRLHELVRKGMVLAGARPTGTLGLVDGDDEEEFNRLVNDIWGDIDGVEITERRFGEGRVFNGLQMSDILNKLNIRPDFEHTSLSGDAPSHYIHRKLNDADVYLVTNPRRTPEEMVCTFRVKDRKPEFWDPVTGKISTCKIYDLVDNRVRLPVRLEPSGSLFVVFRYPASERVRSVLREGVKALSTEPYPVPPIGKYPDVFNDFSISLWVKPEIDIGMGSRNLRSYKGRMRTDYHLCYPTEGEVAYGNCHAACSMTMGRNGVVVWERATGDPVDVLIAETPVSGWTHVTLVYKGGRSFLFLNGSFIKEGDLSGKIVHPGMGDYIPHDGKTYYYYNGGMTVPRLFNKVLTDSHIRSLSLEKMHDPPAPGNIEFSYDQNDQILIWQDGDYTFQDNSGNINTIQVSGTGKLYDISGNWDVFFPPYRGAPSRINLSELISFNRHSDEGVKYFSGTAAYRRKFVLSESDISKERRIYLDLGRVEVIAEVIVNNRECGTIWKPPFRMDVTDFLVSGINNLEVRVTNLWPNRLIGDEQYPEEHQYGRPGSVTGGISELPAWFIEGKPRPRGRRIAFSTWKHYHRDSPLLESGMLGPVILTASVHHKL